MTGRVVKVIAGGTGAAGVALDGAFLRRTTFGDEDLKKEILALFLTQIRTARQEMAAADSEASWHFVTHTLKGAASAIGARQFSDLADHWVRQGLPTAAERLAILKDYDDAAAAFAAASLLA
jgi:HPt (histidine-containing phosphotransfer) domain-containing protein